MQVYNVALRNSWILDEPFLQSQKALCKDKTAQKAHGTKQNYIQNQPSADISGSNFVSLTTSVPAHDHSDWGIELSEAAGLSFLDLWNATVL